MLATILLAAIAAVNGGGVHATPAHGTPLQAEAPKAKSAEANGQSRGQTTTLECTNPGAAQTDSVMGPRGATAVLRVETEDDHSKESYDCMADYELEIANGGDGRTADMLSSDAEYGRRITAHLYGFSQDGKRVIGIMSEGGKDATTALFDYHVDGGEARLVDLGKMFLPAVTEKCSEGFDAIGTTADGVVVVELAASKDCGAGGRWAVDSDGSAPKKISAHSKIIPFYGAKAEGN